MLIKLCFFTVFFCKLHCSLAIKEQAETWINIQKQFYECSQNLEQKIAEKNKENSIFFDLQYQLAAIYFSNKRYNTGFGTSVFPSVASIRDFLKKKFFIQLKTKQILPLYQSKALEYQKHNLYLKIEKEMKNLTELHALNDLIYSLFEQYISQNKLPKKINEETNLPIEKIVKNFCEEKIKNEKFNFNIIHPLVCEYKARENKIVYYPGLKSLIISPKSGKIKFLGNFENKLMICISENNQTCIIIGKIKPLVSLGDQVNQKQPIGIFENCEENFELQIYHNCQAIDPAFCMPNN